MIGINFVVCEKFESFVPNEHKEKLESVDWNDIHFATSSICRDSMLMEYEITEEGDFFEKDPETGEIEKLDDYTGDIEMISAVLNNGLNEKDYEVTARALFFKGELKELNFLSLKELDNSERKEAMERTQEFALDYINRQTGFWFKTVDLILGSVRLVFGWLIRMLWVIQTKIT
tara:strand:- start:71 stop:592 length:522 start_codon:yes stop_codon:yes gene_type:complete